MSSVLCTGPPLTLNLDCAAELRRRVQAACTAAPCTRVRSQVERCEESNEQFSYPTAFYRGFLYPVFVWSLPLPPPPALALSLSLCLTRRRWRGVAHKSRLLESSTATS